MESPSTRYIPQNSMKRVFPGGGNSSHMDPDVIEISPPTPSTHRTSNSKPYKKKAVMLPEIIDVDMDEDSSDVMLIDKEVDTKKKGKGVLVNDSKVLGNTEKVGLMDVVQSSKKTSDLAPDNVIDLDGSVGDQNHDWEDDYMDSFIDDYVFDDDYEILQSHFDNIDLPTGVEAPIPWLPVHSQFGNKSAIKTGSTSTGVQNRLSNAGSPAVDTSHSIWTPGPSETRKMLLPSSSSDSKIHLKSGIHVHGVNQSSFPFWPSAEQDKSKKMSAVFNNSNFGSPQVEKSTVYVPADIKPSKGQSQSSSSRNKRKRSLPGDASHHSSHDKMGGIKLPAAAQPFNYPPSSKYQVGSLFPDPGLMEKFSKWKYSSFKKTQPYMGASSYSAFHDPFDGMHQLPENDSDAPGVQDPAKSQNNSSDASTDDILAKLQLFKKFDTVEDHSDHHFTSSGSSSKQPSKNWAKKIQDEWKILEKDLPDTIFVRVYESRMDLLRAVIIGAEGTPYHDGLFFFDVFFPSSYPNVPPKVHYHSGGLRINPNLYNCGKVCLSLLNTWTGGKKEKWIPGVSTMLQVLVSIQGLILNAKPYFNEPGFAKSSGSPTGEKVALKYNEDTFLLSLKTMIYTLRRPPKYFEHIVAGHFCKYGHDILVACKAYIEGAQVGCLVRGGVQDVDEGDKSCSQNFKDNVAAHISGLVEAFSKVGAKNTNNFLALAQIRSTPVPVVPTASNIYGPKLK